jgi:hypothetical protein
MFAVLLRNHETNIKQIEMQNNENIEIKKMLPAGSYKIISNRINGKYTPGTIRQMINGWRTMNPAVLQEAKELIKFINPETNDEYQTINK